MIWEVNGPQHNLWEKDLNPTSFNGSDSSNGVKARPQDCSIMRFLTQPGSDMVVILITLRRFFTHSPMLIKINNWSSVLTLLLKRAESNGERNGIWWARWFLNLSLRKTLYIPMKFPSSSHKSLISEEYGNTIESTFSRQGLRIWSQKANWQNKKHLPLRNLLVFQTSHHSICSSMPN